jgi:hypothetical protein
MLQEHHLNHENQQAVAIAYEILDQINDYIDLVETHRAAINTDTEDPGRLVIRDRLT